MAELGTNICVIIGLFCINYLDNRTLVKLSVGQEILENMVTGFVSYTPPLELLFTSALPHPVDTIIVIVTDRPGPALFDNHLTAGVIPKPV